MRFTVAYFLAFFCFPIPFLARLGPGPATTFRTLPARVSLVTEDQPAVRLCHFRPELRSWGAAGARAGRAHYRAPDPESPPGATEQLVTAECKSADYLFTELGDKLLYLSPFPPAVKLQCVFQEPLSPHCSTAWSLPADPCPTSGAKRKDVEE